MLLGSEFDCDDRGDHELKGLDGCWRLHELR
jgi:hypothetical protein